MASAHAMAELRECSAPLLYFTGLDPQEGCCVVVARMDSGLTGWAPISCVTSGKRLNPSVLQAPHLEKYDSSTHTMGLL